MAIQPFSGFLAVGVLDGSFVDFYNQESTILDFHRQPVDLTGGGLTSSLSFSNSIAPWGLVNAVGIYAAADDADLIVYWPLARWLNLQRGIIFFSPGSFSLDFDETSASEGDPVGTVTNRWQPTTVYAGSFFNNIFSPG